MNKRFYLFGLLLGAFIFMVATLIVTILPQKTFGQIPESQSFPVQKVDPQVSANGTVASGTEATLHFQTSGKLIRLPYQEGDTVKEGQAIAQLDTYALSRQLQIAANTYESTQNTTNQTVENGQAGVLEGQQRVSLDTYNKSGYSTIPESTVIYDAVKRMVDTSLASQDSAELNVELARYALQLATLTAPINGIITHEDVTVPNVNITTLTSFTIQDPSDMIFRAQVAETDIDFVSVGSKAIIQLNSNPQKDYTGTVVKIYPEKTTSSDGQSVYSVDVRSDELKKSAKFDQSGQVMIQSNTRPSVVLVPSWLVLSHKYVWVVDSGGNASLKTVETGKTHGTEIEVTKGLSPSDRVITDPLFIAQKRYQLL